MLVDSHCHLSSPELYENLDDVIRRAKEAGVSFILNAGAKFDELERQLEIARRYPMTATVTGVHPHDTQGYHDVTLQNVLDRTKYREVVAIGECGLDYFYDFAPRQTQIDVFKVMIEASQESGLPLIVHTREADADTAELLFSAYRKKAFSGVIHCYSSGPEIARTALDIGFYISASGMITFNNSADIRERFSKIPRDRLLVETDGPYLAPVPYRGKTNEPAFVVETARRLAEVQKTDFDTIARVTTQNFFKLFHKITVK